MRRTCKTNEMWNLSHTQFPHLVWFVISNICYRYPTFLIVVRNIFTYTIWKCTQRHTIPAVSNRCYFFCVCIDFNLMVYTFSSLVVNRVCIDTCDYRSNCLINCTTLPGCVIDDMQKMPSVFVGGIVSGAVVVVVGDDLAKVFSTIFSANVLFFLVYWNWLGWHTICNALHFNQN